MVKTGMNRLQPSLEGEKLRDLSQGADSWVRADCRCDVMPAVVRNSSQPAVTRDEAGHVGRDVEAGQHNTRNSGSDRGRRRGGVSLTESRGQGVRALMAAMGRGIRGARRRIGRGATGAEQGRGTPRTISSIKATASGTVKPTTNMCADGCGAMGLV